MTKPLITMVVPFYRQPQMLLRQLQTWMSYGRAVLDAFNFVIVDDCSPESAATAISAAYYDPPPNVSLYRIDVDVPWNRGMARNLGTHVAETDWVLHVDTDHVLPPEGAEALACRTPDSIFGEPHWYRFSRRRIGAADETRKKDKADPKAEWAVIHPHIDSYLCTKRAYWAAGGYNEDFSGVLGGGSPFLKEMEKANGAPITLDVPLHVYTRHAIPDSSEHTLSRNPERFKKRKAEIMKARGTLRGHDPLRLPWHKVF